MPSTFERIAFILRNARGDLLCLDLRISIKSDYLIGPLRCNVFKRIKSNILAQYLDLWPQIVDNSISQVNINYIKLLLLLFILVMNNFCIAESYTFTNASATGENGPTQNQINSEYAGTNLANSVTINSQGIQEWVAPASGTYEIEAWGAQGGSGGWYSNSSYSSTGGLGRIRKRSQ